MCFKRKQRQIDCSPIAAVALVLSSFQIAHAEPSAGGVALGDSSAGVTDRVFVLAPPNWSFVVSRESGSFLDCGDGEDVHFADKNGQLTAPLVCGVTLTETLVIPAAATSARVVVHY